MEYSKTKLPFVSGRKYNNLLNNPNSAACLKYSPNNIDFL